MEPKVIKEEPDTKDPSAPTPPPSGRKSKCLKSPESPEYAPSNATPPSASQHVSSTLHTTPPPISGPVLSPNNSNTGSSSPPAATRPNLSKLKRFLSTLVQFGMEISADLGDKIRTLVLSLVNSSLTLEEFHTNLQEATNFPLRPFVLPFLKTHLPLLQREIAYQARIAKQPTSQFLRQHEQLVLDPSFSPSEASEIFNSDTSSGENGKRKHSEHSIYENGISTRDDGNPTGGTGSEQQPPQKREKLHPHSQSLPILFNSLNPLSSFQPFTSNNPSFQFANYNNHHYGAASGAASAAGFHLLSGLGASFSQNLTASAPPHLLTAGDNNNHHDVNMMRKEDRNVTNAEEEWKNINTMLNCILSMVEKTKRALSILQTRDRGISSESDMKKAANEIIRLTEDRIAEIKRKAEEAVNEVKRQAMIELERITVKNMKNKEDSEDTCGPDVATSAQQNNLCWNCGRKAQETCSGCNTARYCGSYCQHRDWENHHQVCCQTDRRQQQQHILNFTTGASSKHSLEDRRQTFEDRRNQIDDQHVRRLSSDENRKTTEELKRMAEKEKSNDPEKKDQRTGSNELEKNGSESLRKFSELTEKTLMERSRLLPNLTTSQLLSIDNIRRVKNHILNRESESCLENSTTTLRSNRSLNNSRSTTPVSASSSVNDTSISK